MTKEEARGVLVREGYCLDHGIKLVTTDKGYSLYGYCPECRRLEEKDKKRRIKEAKKTLGIL